jgi:hypothetical protein
MNLSTSLVAASIALAACSKTHAVTPDGATPEDAPTTADAETDAAGMPPPPALGAQLDRAGRPGIRTILIGGFSAPADQPRQKDAYGRAADPASWRTTMLSTNLTIEAALQTSLAAFDAIDPPAPPMGCGNGLAYTPPVNAISYRAAADLLADDQLYLDTSKATCNVYLALEIPRVTAGAFIPLECGGRMLTQDAIDVTYSVLASGEFDGLDTGHGFTPLIHGSLTAHTDVTTTFPFLGPPHAP